MSINKPLAVTVGLALFATPLPSQARPGPPPQPTFTAPAKRVAQQVVYHWKKTVDSNGRVTESTPVRTLIDRFDESDFWIDLDALEDSEGQSYRMEADAWQSEGSDEVHYKIKVVRVKHTQVSDAKRAKAWAEENSGAQFDAFLADKRATAATAPPRLVDGLERWLVEAEKDETVDVVVMLDHEPAFDLPKLSSTLFSDEPAMALAQMHDRIVAIELRKNELELVQRPLVDELKRDGVRIHKQYWLINGFEAQVSAARLAALVADPRIRQIERRVAPTPDVNNLDDMREGAQIVQLHDAGFEGEDPSGMSSFNGIQIAVIDDSIDADHPAWDDWAGGPSRLLDIWRETGGVWSTVAVSATALPSHGTKVAGLALADLMQGQDPAIISVADREDRTGFAPRRLHLSK
ncbi:MAG: S8/S53 family peptidase, partial [Nannocystaceae bacterium]|nr:S8/S53 family peptidase [Nannocystaceae bacterium]